MRCREGNTASTRPCGKHDLSEGDLAYTTDFRSTYATILERWLGLDPDPIVHGRFEQFDFVAG